MILYLSIIFVSMIIITLLNILFAASFNILSLGMWVTIVTILQIVIDVVIATVVRWVLPEKLVSIDKKIYCASKKEAKFYERIGIKKWKDKTLELGSVTGFRKNKLGDANDNEYVKRFIIESNYGILVHLFCVILGVSAIFVCPKTLWFSVGVPVTIVNILLNSMSLFILRYNLPKLHTLYKYNQRRLERNKLSA